MCKLGFCDQMGDIAVSFGFVQMQLYLIIMAVAQGLFQPENTMRIIHLFYTIRMILTLFSVV